ncbi:MAG: hypothetical protein HKN19_08335, partial [Halioglobus sp.]|nr:hypothetical protein [Halioglobus sp.]
IDGAVQYRLPRAMPWLRHFANAHSRLLYFILTRLDRLSFKSGVDPGGEPQGIASDPEMFNESVQVTQELLHKIRARVAPSIPVYAFATDNSDPYGEQFRHLSTTAGLHYVEEVPASLGFARQGGVNIYSADRQHWNNAGHALVADALYEPLKTQ